MNQKSFTLIEIVVTLIVVGILVTMGLSYYGGSFKNAYQNDACNDLKAINMAQQSYMESHNYTYYNSGSSCPAADDSSLINQNLKLNITPTGQTKFCCNTASGVCTAYLQDGSSLTVASSKCVTGN